MTPLRVKDYVQQNKQVSRSQLAQYFSIEKSLAGQLISFWVSRGKMKALTSCDHCLVGCQEESYIWVASV
jgi:predicted HTH transcriptional regulator